MEDSERIYFSLGWQFKLGQITLFQVGVRFYEAGVSVGIVVFTELPFILCVCNHSGVSYSLSRVS